MSGLFNDKVKLVERCIRKDKSAWDLFVEKHIESALKTYIQHDNGFKIIAK